MTTTPVTVDGLRVAMLPASATQDAALMAEIASFVNHGYAVGEEGMWAAEVSRIDAAGVAEFVAVGELALAHLDGAAAGCIRVHRIDADTEEFGLLASAVPHRGVGTALIRFAESSARLRGVRAMQLEVIAPAAPAHPRKATLAGWYRSLGYLPVRRSLLAELHPELVAQAAVECAVTVYRKSLADPRDPDAADSARAVTQGKRRFHRAGSFHSADTLRAEQLPTPEA